MVSSAFNFAICPKVSGFGIIAKSYINAYATKDRDFEMDC
jgi:hypothetical protein